MKSVDNRRLRVFLCHSSNDKPLVRELYQKLRAENWIQPWLDEEELYPGEDWNMEIEKAVEAADAIIVCLTNNSITKEGYIQRELRIVLDFCRLQTGRHAVHYPCAVGRLRTAAPLATLAIRGLFS